MSAVIDHEIQQDLSIALNLAKTSALQHPIHEAIYERYKKQYGQPETFRLCQNSNGTCYFKGYHDGKIKPVPSTEKPISYVIQKDPQTGKKILRLGTSKHYYIADKATSVIAAGDVIFEHMKIKYLNDQSGSYCIESTDPLKKEKREAVLSALQEVGFPMECFSEYTPNTTFKRLSPLHTDAKRPPITVSATATAAAGIEPATAAVFVLPTIPAVDLITPLNDAMRNNHSVEIKSVADNTNTVLPNVVAPVTAASTDTAIAPPTPLLFTLQEVATAPSPVVTPLPVLLPSIAPVPATQVVVDTEEQAIQVENECCDCKKCVLL